MRSVTAVLLLMTAGCNENGSTPDTTRPPDQRGTDVRTDGPRPDVCVSTNPVKILFVVDVSGSMQFTDPKIKRQAAVKLVVDTLKNRSNLSFAVIGYNARVTVNGATSAAPIFTTDPTALATAIGGLAQADVISDLQSALTTASQLLADDIQKAASVAKTRYVAILLSDGGTGPVCTAGCNNDPKSLAGECTGGSCGTPPAPGHDGGPRDAGLDLASWCDIPRAQWCAAYNPASCSDMTQWFPAMTAPCLDYNTEQLLVSKVKEIVALKDQHKAGAVQLHAVRLIDTTVSADVLKLMGVDPAKAETFLRKLATEGGGTYLDLYGASADLLQLPLQPLCP